MATKVRLANIWIIPLDWPTTKNPHRCKILGGIYLKCELSCCDFCVEISTFSLPWQRRLVWHKFHLHSEIGSSRKPLFGARISYTSWVIADFLMKFTDFCYYGNQSGSSENLNDSIGLADHENPTQVQNAGIYLKCELSYCDNCVEISTFSLPWQQGLVWHKFHLHSEIGSSRKPLFGARISYISWVIADFLMKFTDFYPRDAMLARVI